jgi:cytochrome c553
MTMRRTVFAAAGCLAALLSLTAYAVSTSRQELLDALHSRPSLDRGAELFRPCTACHGPSGAGTLDGGVPRIAAQHASVLAKQLVDYRHDRRWDLRMEHFADGHHLVDAQAIADITAYIHQLDISSAPGVGTGDLVEHGASVYVKQCSSCHGPAGEGNAKKLIPRVAGQHYEYLMRQIYDAVDGRRPNFSATHIRLLARLQRDDIVGLADFLSRIPPRSDPPAALQTGAH